MDDFERDLLPELMQAEHGASSDQLLERLSAGERRKAVMYTERTVEHALFGLRDQGLVAEAEGDAAEVQPPGQPASTAKRYWEITDAGRDALRDEA